MLTPSNPILVGNETVAYRDPACCYRNGTFYLFMTVSVKRDGYMYNHVGISTSRDLLQWSEPRLLTESDVTKNYCSPGNILFRGEEAILCITSYPMPYPYAKNHIADETARLYMMRTKDFETFTEPEPIMAKGDVPLPDMGRMIDPFLLRDRDDPSLFHLFFKQNGISHSHSRDLQHWEYDGRTEGGENASVILRDGVYHLIHSPQNGIGHLVSRDLRSWEELGITTLLQSEWDWASGRLTAGFIMEAPAGFPSRYLLFFHGSKKDAPPETHGAASIGIAYTDDLIRYRFK